MKSGRAASQTSMCCTSLLKSRNPHVLQSHIGAGHWPVTETFAFLVLDAAEHTVMFCLSSWQTALATLPFLTLSFETLIPLAKYVNTAALH